MESISLSSLPWNPLAVVGASGSGKTQFLRELTKNQPNAIVADERVLPKRGRVGDLATEYRKRVMPQKADEVLEILNLEKHKNTRFHDLTPGQASAACLFPALALEAPLYEIDMLLDWVDWNVAQRIWDSLATRAQKGSKVIITTHSPIWLSKCEGFALIKDQKITQSNSLQKAMSEIAPIEFVIESENGDALAEILKPFEIQIEQRGNEFTFRTTIQEGLVLELLNQGYGKVKTVKAVYPDAQMLLARLVS